MNCTQCGAELRPGARFCNRCGASQPEDMSTTAGQPAAIATVEQLPIVTDDAGPAKRPPRPLRWEDDADADADADDSDAPASMAAPEAPAEEAEAAVGTLPAMPPLPERDTAPDEQATDTPGAATENADETLPAVPDDAAEPAGAPDVPVTEMIATPSSLNNAAEAASALDAPAAGSEGEAIADVEPALASEAEQDLPSQPLMDAADDEASVPAPFLADTPSLEPEVMPPPPAEAAPSWPLAAGAVAGGRYRIEQVLAAAEDTPGAENSYLVTDLRGYERCWSCGAEPGGTSASEQFCEKCGADLLGREYVMTERRLGVSGAEKTAPLPGGPAKPGAIAFFEAQRVYRVTPRAADLPPFPAGPHLVVGATTDIGLTRQSGRNEDSLGVSVLSLNTDGHRRTLGVFIIADGLGGHADGHEASRAVVRVFTDSLVRALLLPLCDGAPDPTPDMLREALIAAARAANKTLLAANNASGADSGSTLAAALIWDETAYVANVGDSRCYVCADGTLRRLTIDHSLVENLIAGGIVAPEERYTHPQRNQILRSLGDDANVNVDIFEQQLRPGMRLLLCSDGLWEMVHDDELAQVLTATAHPQDATDALARAANANGGEDNISVIIVEARA
jgi:serine/threonine protein phosphatase PrpC